MSVVTHEIRWLNDLDEARKEVIGTDKLVLFFFHSPGCGGCKKTMETTLPDQAVRELIDRNFIPVTFTVTESAEVSAKYGIEWTPTFIIADADLNELERWVGYLPPQDFIAQVYLSQGLACLHKKRYNDAEGDFCWIIDNLPDSQAAPQARYYLGVTLYKDTGDSGHLVRTWEAMNKRYPGDSWTIKASAWAK